MRNASSSWLSILVLGCFVFIVSWIILVESRVCGLNITSIFFHSLPYFLTLVKVSFDENKFLKLRLSNILYFFSLLELFVILTNAALFRVH